MRGCAWAGQKKPCSDHWPISCTEGYSPMKGRFLRGLFRERLMFSVMPSNFCCECCILPLNNLVSSLDPQFMLHINCFKSRIYGVH